MFLRNGVLTLVVGFTVLVDTYAGAKDNKVLVMSGRLGGQGAFRRLVETARFTQEVVEEGALSPGAPGHEAALRVRLLHARVRAHCKRAGYDVARYDEPINQEAMAGTLMLFSAGVVLALENFGVEITDEEKESYHALFRYVGHLMGVDAELLPETYAGERALYERVKAHQYFPDDDSRALFEAAVCGVSAGARSLPFGLRLLGGGLMGSESFLRQFTAFTVDPRLAAALVPERSPTWKTALHATRAALWVVSRAQRRTPIVGGAFERAQAALFRHVIAEALAGDEARFADAGFAAGVRGAAPVRP